MDHPDEIVTASYLDGSLPAETRETLEAHLADCESCRLGVVLLQGELHGAADRKGSGERVPAEFIARALRRDPIESRGSTLRRMKQWNVSVAAAAVIAIALVATWWMLTGERDATSSKRAAEYRGADGGFSGELSPARGAVVSADDLVFSWSAVEGADRYSVSVLGPGGEVVVSIETRADQRSARWPPDHPLPSRGPLIWKVRAFALDRVIAETRPIPFEIK